MRLSCKPLLDVSLMLATFTPEASSNKAPVESLGKNKASSWLCGNLEMPWHSNALQVQPSPGTAEGRLADDQWLEVPADLIIAASSTVTVSQA
ncbi:hypothetical protein LTR27_007409 [Elasticomyces elasticus]|nr:hypothetical protein LTR27_007409 [Elasticomyces elasticus]